ncbi:U3-containing 90S pre-ribosomal complex subunit-domain containing protein [Dendryphion nanum]|uniref:U3-containing 90S pre-ribosomal complex subunit-domain containing protein n=1 Tax=Dendryphion nanum TaxID=256645 RepID=A0A9P9I6R2_9PLEO|nr:U3-containing 90S pre-ribosomal complex subunit-domain containing protein [Dendryphion nanum]
MSDSEAEGGVPLLEPEFDTTTSSKKRKTLHEPEANSEDKKAAKKARRKAERKEKKKQKAKDIDEDDLDQELGVNHAFERMDSQLLADYINSRTRLYGKDLSSVELEDKFIPGIIIPCLKHSSPSNSIIARCVKDSTSWGKPRTLDNIAAFLKQQSADLKPTPGKPNGAPHTLVVAASGIRSADTFRALKTGLPKQGVKNPNVSKLFAKHMKIAEQVEHLTKHKVDFGVGTPDRLSALLDQKALSTANLKRIVIDVSYIDQKKRGILDMKELHEPLIKLLLREEFVGEKKQGGNDLFVFY